MIVMLEVATGIGIGTGAGTGTGTGIDTATVTVSGRREREAIRLRGTETEIGISEVVDKDNRTPLIVAGTLETEIETARDTVTAREIPEGVTLMVGSGSLGARGEIQGSRKERE